MEIIKVEYHPPHSFVVSLNRAEVLALHSVLMGSRFTEDEDKITTRLCGMSKPEKAVIGTAHHGAELVTELTRTLGKLLTLSA